MMADAFLGWLFGPADDGDLTRCMRFSFRGVTVWMRADAYAAAEGGLMPIRDHDLIDPFQLDQDSYAYMYDGLIVRYGQLVGTRADLVWLPETRCCRRESARRDESRPR